MAHSRIRPLRSFFIRCGIQVLFFLIRIIPVGLLYRLAAWLSDVVYVLARRNSRRALENVRFALGAEVSSRELKRIVRQSCRTMGRAVIDVPRFMQMPAQRVRHLVSIEGGGHVKAGLRAGKGIIAISAHLGSFVLVGSRLVAEGYRVNFVARHMRERSVEHVTLQAARQAGIRIIFNRPAVVCFRHCLMALARNEIVIIEVDQNFGTEGVPVSFFNRPAVMAIGPLMLAQRTASPLIPMFVINEESYRYRVVIEPPLVVASQGKEAERQFGAQLISLLEQYIRERPGQWISWVHKPWKMGA